MFSRRKAGIFIRSYQDLAARYIVVQSIDGARLRVVMRPLFPIFQRLVFQWVGGHFLFLRPTTAFRLREYISPSSFPPSYVFDSADPSGGHLLAPSTAGK